MPDNEMLPGLGVAESATLTDSSAGEITVGDIADRSTDNSSAAATPTRKVSPRNLRRDRTAGEAAGAELERRVARLEFAGGALARLRVPVYVDAEAGRDVLTDLDVLAIDVDNRLRISRSTLECKSGKGQSGEGDRLLWLTGLQKLLGVDRAVLVRQTITRRGRALAARLETQILDVPTLASREAANAWVPDRFAHVDGPACTAAETRTDTQVKALGHISGELISYLRYKSLLEPSHRTLSALAALRTQVERGGVLPYPTSMMLAAHALQSLVLAAISDASRLDTMAVAEIRRRIELALTVGTPDDDHMLTVLGGADVIVSRVVEAIHRSYTEAGADRHQISVPSLREVVAQSPDWVDRYLELVQRLRANPLIARDLPQTVELACFDALLGDSAYKSRAFDHLFTAEHRHLVLAAVRSLGDIASSQLADALAAIGDLNFNRSAPALPDRTSPERAAESLVQQQHVSHDATDDLA